VADREALMTISGNGREESATGPMETVFGAQAARLREQTRKNERGIRERRKGGRRRSRGRRKSTGSTRKNRGRGTGRRKGGSRPGGRIRATLPPEAVRNTGVFRARVPILSSAGVLVTKRAIGLPSAEVPQMGRMDPPQV